ncbi:heterokaryon incompatibility protein-domain-containing protein [Xylariaceae sp. FL0804]|nr:heterokaryon incompatibility protein-domain-containing protein [Xylariaceae sp. FL0804]
MDWHDRSCRRLDLVSAGGMRTCLRCGSFTALASRIHPLIKSQSEIRLLRVRPAEFEETLHCELIVEDIESPHKSDYEAISYTWADENGNSDPCSEIYVAGQPFQVTRNCENVLRRVRGSLSSRLIWIDAICINQADIDERGHQVQLMPRIYSGAKHVLVYVGESADNSDLCLEAIADGMITEHHPGTTRAAMITLLSRRYFRRVWVLQEIALARRATLICGNWSAPWRNLQVPVNNIISAPSRNLRPPVNNIIPPPALAFDSTTYTTPGKFLSLLDLARSCEAKDPRDKVYALLGLVPGASHQHLVADYNLTVEETYTQVALQLASQHGWASVLCRAGLKHQSLSTLPSWVPDWTWPGEILDPTGGKDGSALPAVRYVSDQQALCIRVHYALVHPSYCVLLPPSCSTDLPDHLLLLDLRQRQYSRRRLSNFYGGPPVSTDNASLSFELATDLVDSNKTCRLQEAHLRSTADWTERIDWVTQSPYSVVSHFTMESLQDVDRTMLFLLTSITETLVAPIKDALLAMRDKVAEILASLGADDAKRVLWLVETNAPQHADQDPVLAESTDILWRQFLPETLVAPFNDTLLAMRRELAEKLASLDAADAQIEALWLDTVAPHYAHYAHQDSDVLADWSDVLWRLYVRLYYLRSCEITIV